MQLLSIKLTTEASSTFICPLSSFLWRPHAPVTMLPASHMTHNTLRRNFTPWNEGMGDSLTPLSKSRAVCPHLATVNLRHWHVDISSDTFIYSTTYFGNIPNKSHQLETLSFQDVRHSQPCDDLKPANIEI